jgi:CRP-like cAMP-binding protein
MSIPMIEADDLKNNISKTPRVDVAELFFYANKREPVGFVLSSLAKLLEIELNQALEKLKSIQSLTPEVEVARPVETIFTPEESNLQVHSSEIADLVNKKVPSLEIHGENTPTDEVKKSEPSAVGEDLLAESKEPRAHVIEPSKSPEGAGESVEYEDGAILFNKGDSAEHLSILLEGSVEVFDPVDNLSLAKLGAGCSFGEQAILEGGLRVASVKALGKVKCLEIKTEPVRALLKNDSGLLLQTLEGLLLQLSMCNQISKIITTPDADLVYELLGDEQLTSIQLLKKLNDAYKNSDSHGLSAEQMMYLKLQSSDKLMAEWFESGKELGSPLSEHMGSAYVIVEGSVSAQCGSRTIRLGHGSVMGLAEGITGSPFPWTLVANDNVTVKSIPIYRILQGLARSNSGIKGIVRYTTSRILEMQKTFVI